jgi:Tfp pilus assembly protein PilV
MMHARVEVRRGLMLLECLLALAVFVAAGLTILSMCDQASGSMQASRDLSRATDLARSSMAKLEAGLVSAETLNGPAAAWTSDDAYVDVPGTPSGGWTVEVRTAPSSFDGLTLVTLRAFFMKASGEEGVSYTLHQLVRLGAAGGGRERAVGG